jgi:Skp family chaperone for outer membrane proteins
VGGAVTAQNNPAAATSAAVQRTRIAFVNMQEVLKAYPKFRSLEGEVKKKNDDYVGVIKTKQDRVAALRTEYQNPATTEQRKTQIENDFRIIQADMQNIQEEAKKTITKFSDEAVSQIYNELDAVVREYAGANGIDIVFRYTEDWTKETYNKPDRIISRMSMPLWPMYYDRNLDVTVRISALLNQRFPSTAQTQPGTTGAANTAGATGAAGAAGAAGTNTVVPAGGRQP